MSLLQNSNAIESGGYLIERSLRFQSASSQYLSRTPASASNRKTWTWSGWIKRGTINSSGSVAYPLFAVPTGTTDATWFEFRFVSDTLYIGGYSTNWRITTQVFRDPSAWYHIVLAVDTTQATANDRLKLYVNGTQVTAFTTTNNPTQNADLGINQASATYIGLSNAQYFDGYMTEINFIDGQALTPSSFGETDALTGVWVAKKYTGTYGTNGFYLKFNDGTSTTTLGTDSSGNANNWTLTNFTRSAGVSDCWMYDVPSGNGGVSATQPSSNYCVMNQLAKGTIYTLSKANLNVQSSGMSQSVNATMGVSSGKWYWETVLTAATDATIFGIDEVTELPTYPGVTSTSYSFYPTSALKINNGVQTSYGVTATTNDVIGCALDMDNGKIWWSKNGVWMSSGDPVAGTNAAFTGITGIKTPAIGDGSSTTNVNVDYNFGQRSFAYTPPSGFKALCTANLPAPTIAKGNQYMDVSTYTGTGASQSIVNSGAMQPDFVWFKRRSAAENHWLVDAIRGVSNGLYSNLTNAEATQATCVTSFNSNGFTVGTDAAGFTNVSGQTYVAWQWDAGSSTVTNTSGSISSQVRANTTAGFSIVTYTGNSTSGATIGHGLGIAPKMIITKTRNTTLGNWGVYHESLGNTKGLNLNTTVAAFTGAAWWNNTTPTSSVFTVGNGNDVNGASTYVAYCFAEIAGFSKIGSYTGNGSTDGPFIYCGFRPKFVIIKMYSGAVGQSWALQDTSRSTYNASIYRLQAESSNAENSSTSNSIDILSNGFKIRTTDNEYNNSSYSYIVAAFAENPFQYANAR